MAKARGQYVGQTSGIHSIQEKDDIFETDIDNQGANYDKNRDFGQLMSLGKLNHANNGFKGSNFEDILK